MIKKSIESVGQYLLFFEKGLQKTGEIQDILQTVHQ